MFPNTSNNNLILHHFSQQWWCSLHSFASFDNSSRIVLHFAIGRRGELKHDGKKSVVPCFPPWSYSYAHSSHPWHHDQGDRWHNEPHETNGLGYCWRLEKSESVARAKRRAPSPLHTRSEGTIQTPDNPTECHGRRYLREIGAGIPQTLTFSRGIGSISSLSQRVPPWAELGRTNYILERIRSRIVLLSIGTPSAIS